MKYTMQKGADLTIDGILSFFKGIYIMFYSLINAIIKETKERIK